MRTRCHSLCGWIICLASLLSAALGQETPGLPLDKIRLPEGFKISLYAEGVRNARAMALGPDGTLYVGTRRLGSVFAVRDENGDHRADRVYTLAEKLRMPTGVAFRDGALYVAEVSRVLRYDDIASRLDNPPEPVVVTDSYPTDRHHGWKFIDFGPDGMLYIPVGAPCNICERLDDPRYTSITRVKPDGSGAEIFVTGVRNTVGFTWHPVTGEMWFTDNGRDMLGDDIPPDELNRVSSKGEHFGYPYCHGGFLADPEFGEKRPCSDLTSPAMNLGPHVAALGLEFYTGNQFPEDYRNQLFIAEHGSWNRSEKIGFRLTLVRIVDNRKAVYYQTFADGWLNSEKNEDDEQEEWGRPVDVLQMPDGALLVSDDKAGVIYRISYEPDS